MALARMDGKVVLVTGGTQGIGEGVALLCAEQGAAGVLITGRNVDNGARVCAALEDGGCDAAFIRADLTVERECREVVAECDRRFGRVDGLVNAAAQTTRGTLDDTSVELWDYLHALNVRAPFILTQEAARVMRREGRGGSIVNIITMSSHGGQPFIVAYSVSKGALAVLTKNTAHSLRFDRIRVNGHGC